MPHTDCMTLPPRDRQVIRGLDAFRQLTTGQVRRLVFHAATSRTTCDRALKRLFDDGYIRQVVRNRPVGGSHGGSGEYVWALTRKGRNLAGDTGRGRRHYQDRHHTLSIAEVYIRAVEEQRRGDLTIGTAVTEPDCWQVVGGIQLEPDMYLELERPSTGRTARLWCEIDLGTESPSRLRERFARYIGALDRSRGELAVFPLVVFLADDDARVHEIAKLISKLDEQDQRLFRSLSITGFPQSL